MIEPIAPIEPPRPADKPQVTPIEPPTLRAAMNGDRRFIVQFKAGTPLPGGDEIDCDPATLKDIFPEDTRRSLVFSTSTAWLARLYPADLAKQMDEQAAGLSDPYWPDISRPGFSRYYRLRFTGGLEDDYILETLARADTVQAAQVESPLVLLASAVDPTTDPNFKDQDYLRAAPEGVDAKAGWDEGADGSGITVGQSESGTPPSGHPDLSFRILAAGGSSQEHIVNVAALIAAANNDKGIVGVAPKSALVFSATDGTPPAGSTLPANASVSLPTYAGIARLNAPNVLSAGDVVNLSIGASLGLNQKNAPQHVIDDLLRAAISSPTGKQAKVSTVAGQPRTLKAAQSELPVEVDPAILALVRQLSARGITVCMGSGNGFKVAGEIGGTALAALSQTAIGADVTLDWLQQVHSLNRANKKFKEGGGIVVGGSFFSTKQKLNLPTDAHNHGNRLDCHAHSSLVFTWGTSSLGPQTGTSVATPIVAGAAALVQSYLKKNYQVTLQPRILRALFSDPFLNTLAPGKQFIGPMPDLAQIFSLLKTTPFDKDQLAAALKDKAEDTRKTLSTIVGVPWTLAGLALVPIAPDIAVNLIAKGTGPQDLSFLDPYSSFNEGSSKWEPLALDAANLFNP